MKDFQYHQQKLTESGTMTQYFEILKYRNDETIHKTNDAVHRNSRKISELIVVSVQGNEALVVPTAKSQQDSRVMKILTVVASLYLPAALVAAVFNSNLLKMDAERHVVAASNFWMFLLFTVALSVFTLIPAGTWSYYSTKKEGTRDYLKRKAVSRPITKHFENLQDLFIL